MFSSKHLFLRPPPDLVPVPGHCALALKGMLFRQGAQNHFLAVCIYNSNRFVDRLTAATSNRRETCVRLRSHLVPEYDSRWALM